MTGSGAEAVVDRFTIQEADAHRNRARVRQALVLAGLSPEEAEEWCGLWEREAARRAISPSPYFWDSGRGWIDAHLAFARQRRSQGL
jgi:hypothetical protein